MAHAAFRLDPSGREVLYEQIVHTLHGLPGDLREVFVMLHYEGKSLTEAARTLALSEAEVVARLQMANDTFYELLGETVN